MKNKLYITFGMATLLVACSHFDELQKNPKESNNKESESHNMGQNCMKCHNDNSNDASFGRWWNVAGTAYDDTKTPVNGLGSVELWTGPSRTGQLLYKLQVDKKGNFYTNKIIDFKGGFYPVLINADGSFNPDNAMTQKTNIGSCNSCHDDVTQEKIIFYKQ